MLDSTHFKIGEYFVECMHISLSFSPNRDCMSSCICRAEEQKKSVLVIKVMYLVISPKYGMESMKTSIHIIINCEILNRSGT